MNYDGFATIGIGGKKFTGKSTFAAAIADVCLAHNLVCARYYFAKPLKEACHILFGGTEANWYGDFKTQELESWSGIPVLGTPTPRRIMQYVGTELFRKNVCEDFWLRAAQRYIQDIYDADPFDVLVIDDVRFDNEANFLIDGYNASIVNLYRGNMPDAHDAHASERGLSTHLIDYSYNCEDRSLYHMLATDVLRRVGRIGDVTE